MAVTIGPYQKIRYIFCPTCNKVTMHRATVTAWGDGDPVCEDC